MSVTQKKTDPAKLQRMWQKRCQQGNFSSGVLGVGTIRIFGKSGDAPVTFPRIESLIALDTLEADERWAIEVAQEVVSAAQAKKRPIMAAQPSQIGTAPTSTPVRTFDPKLEHILILSLTRGG